jgi:hypothetical protein
MPRWTIAARIAAGLAVLCGTLSGGAAAALDDFGPADVTLFRLFLNDGSSLVSYGEFARVNDRVVFSMPTSASLEAPQLHLVNIAAARVDWARTNKYADTARAARYVATHGERQYAMLSIEIGQALNDVTLTQDPIKRLAIVERARRTLIEWPRYHFNYKADEIQKMVATLDGVIAELRAAAGVGTFDLNFVASPPMPQREPLAPLPTAKEAIEQTLLAASLAESSAERTSLMSVALAGLDRDAAVLPADWSTDTRAAIKAGITAELETDRVYQALTSEIVKAAAARAKAADVRGVERLLSDIPRRDKTLGGKRPDAVAGLIAAVEAELDAARRMRLELDRWAIRLPELKKYYSVISGPLNRLNAVAAPLEDIKALSGSSPQELAAVEQVARQVIEVVSPLVPPTELSAAHALLLSAAQLARSAAYIRREAALSGSVPRAWDASSAAAGALMLGSRARTEMQSLMRAPQLPR